jgi:uncharacterized protein YjbI with pentapeptide repeats
MANPEHFEILLKGIDYWNQWRKDRPDLTPDFSGAHVSREFFTEIDEINLISEFFSDIDLLEIDISGANLSNIDLSNADLYSSSFSDVNLSEANLSGSNLSEAELCGVNLINVDFTGANLSNTKFIGSSLNHANLSYVDLSSSDLRGADMSVADLRGANLSTTDLRTTIMQGTDFYGANLFGANLCHGSLSYSDLRKADLRDAELQGCELHDVNFHEADLRGADLSGADLTGANLQGADLRDSYLNAIDFSDKNISDTNFSGANLCDSNFNSANFQNADLTNADLSCIQALGANFKGAILTGACIEDWNINSSTQLEDIICDYVYQKKDRQERRPSSGNFQPGDFTRLYQRAIETLDLIFQDGIDWKSFAVTLQTLNTEQKLNIEGENNQLSVRAIEKRDDGSFVIRVDVPKLIDKAKIEVEIKQIYEIKLIAQTEEYRKELQAKDRDIEWHRKQIEWLQGNTNFQNLIPILAEHQKTPDIIINIDSKSMANNESKGDTITNSGNMGIGINRGEIESSKIAGTINEASNPSLVDAAAEIRDLLTELEKSYPTTTTIEQMTIATEAIKRIEANPNQKKRIVNALKSGGVSAFEKILDNPLGAFMKGAWEGWEKES